MSRAEQEHQKPESTSLPIKWHVPENLQSRYANNVLVQSTPNEIVVSFFETLIPPLAGTSEENAAKLKEIGAIQADCVARVIISPGVFPLVVEALQTGLETYRQAYESAKIEE